MENETNFQQKMINRLGFDAWAMSIAADAIYNIVFPGCGYSIVENNDMSYRLDWTDEQIDFSMRAYTDKGWKEWRTSLKR